MSTTLHQTTQAPPLSQSRQTLMACPALYASRIIAGNKEPENIYARRGQDIHSAIAAYVRHLVETRQPSDYAYFEHLLAEGYVSEAVEILSTLKESFIIDPEKVLGVEMYLALDPYFAALEIGDFGGDVPVAYEGTLDYVQFTDATTAEIWDWKSFWQIIDADTFQSKLYPLLLFCHYPHVETVHFHLKFVRYGASRSVTYTRADLPKLKALAERERARQLAMHRETNEGAVLAAMPGDHCAYCPKLFSGCPIAEINPYTSQSPEDHLRVLVFSKQVVKHTTQILKSLAGAAGAITTEGDRLTGSESGTVSIKDGNAREYRASFVQKVRTAYPLDKTLPVLELWRTSSGEDLTDRLKISATDLNKYAKAKKRAPLAEELASVKHVTEYTEFRVTGVEDEEED